MDFCFEVFFWCTDKAGAQNIESQVRRWLTMGMGKIFCEWDLKGEGYWAARRSTPLSSHDEVPLTTKGNDGRPEEMTHRSLGEEGSTRQLETHHHHSPNTKKIRQAKLLQTYQTSRRQHSKKT